MAFFDQTKGRKIDKTCVCVCVLSFSLPTRLKHTSCLGGAGQQITDRSFAPTLLVAMVKGGTIKALAYKAAVVNTAEFKDLRRGQRAFLCEDPHPYAPRCRRPRKAAQVYSCVRRKVTQMESVQGKRRRSMSFDESTKVGSPRRPADESSAATQTSPDAAEAPQRKITEKEVEAARVKASLRKG